VFNTWPNGPADKAGICPGDQIVAVEGIPVAGHSFGQMLKEITSPFPSPITLKVKRGDQEMEFHSDRVRESTLAALSHEKFMRGRGLFSGIRPGGIVPLDETREELEEAARFYEGIERRVGFKFANGMVVPQGTPEEQVKKLAELQAGGLRESRSVGGTPVLLGQASSIPGFTTMLLKNPEEVLVGRVVPNSPAHRAGLFPGDQILEVNGHPVAGLNEDQLTDLILKPDEPREISLKLQRGASTVALKIQTQKYEEFANPGAFQFVPGYPVPIKPESYVLGFYVLYAENPREAMVDRVDYPSPAFDAGLHVGDRLLKVSDVPIEQITPQQIRDLLEPKGPTELSLEISRVGKKLELHIKPLTYAEAQGKIGRKITKKGPAPQHCPEG
jgi:C-terminal processing protease CtpA/Prc